ncbi:uncharacterized protein [Antedon mediterranea]|uniref:uncharacterized protein n=1 Tax=Antedon mediterranea TaxID=105859 RepID=UPI003AF9AF9F
MFSQMFRKSQHSRENKKAFESLQRSMSNGSFGNIETDENNEEDGFLVVGETEKERNTIKPLPAPPSYEMYQQYSPYTQSSPTNSVNHSQQQSNAFHQVNTPLASNHSSKVSPMDGVPFQLSPSVSMMMGSSLNDLNIPPIKTFEENKFVYDFSHERSVLKEY